MAETKSASRSGSKLNLNESTMPLLDEEAHEKAETPEKDAIELKEKASTTSEAEKDDSNPEKVVRPIFVCQFAPGEGGPVVRNPKNPGPSLTGSVFGKLSGTHLASLPPHVRPLDAQIQRKLKNRLLFLFLSRVAQFGRPSAGFRVKNLKLIPPMECQVDPTPFSTVCVSRHWRRAFYSFLPLLVAS